MSEEIHRRLVTFLTIEFARAEHRTCTKLELSSAPSGTRGTSIKTWERKQEPDVFGGAAQIEDLATEIIQLAEGWATDYGGKHRFVLRAEQHLGGRQHTSFTIASEEGDGGGDDSPTAQGLVSQLMRHNEVNVRTMAAMFQSALGTMSRTVQDLAEENRELRTDRGRQLAELEDSRSRQAERDLVLMERDAIVKRKDAAFGKVIQLLPAVAAKIVGGIDPAGGSSAGLGILLGELADSLQEDQLQKIATVLHPTQGILLAEAIKLARETKAKQEAESQGPETQRPDTKTG